MALSFVGITSKAGEGDGAWDIPIHASAIAGDFAVIFYANDNTINPSLSGDSTLINAISTGTSTFIRGWSKTLTSGEITAGVITLTDSGGNGGSGACVMGVWRDAGTVDNGTVDLRSFDTNTFTLDNVGLSSGGHYFGVAFIDDDLTTVSSYPTDYTLSRGSLQCGSAGSGGTLAWARTESLPTNTNEFVFNSSDTGIAIPYQIDEGVTYNETITETLTASDSVAAAATVNAAVSESVTGADSFAVAATINTALSESVTASDLYGQLFNETLTETLTASDAFLGGTDYYQTISESIAATDSYGATVTEPGGWTIPAPPTDGWIEKGSDSGAWTEISDTDTDWTEI